MIRTCASQKDFKPGGVLKANIETDLMSLFSAFRNMDRVIGCRDSMFMYC